jgi:WD40 repeat protein
MADRRRWRGLRSPGVGAGLSTALALAAGLVINLATTGTTVPIVAGLSVLVVASVGFEVWRATGDDDDGGRGPTGGRGGPAGAPRRRPWMAPPLDRMVDRPQVTEPLLAALTRADRPEADGRVVGLHGAGGFGKTRLATWACHRAEIDRRYPGGLLWVTLGQELQGANLAVKINDATAALSGERPPISDPDAAGAELGRILDEGPPVLVVVDDVWDARQLRPFRIGGRASTRLVTTRIPDVLPLGCERIAVDALSDDQARTLVTAGLRGPNAEPGVGPLAPASADALAAAGHRCPVLLNAINGVLLRLVDRGQPVEEAVQSVLGRLATAGPTALDPARVTERNGVGPTVEASIGLLAPADQARYRQVGVFPEDVDIPLDVLRLLWPDARVPALCDELVALGLVADYRLDPPGPRLVLHDLFREYVRWHQDADERAAVHRRLVDSAVTLLPPPAGGSTDDGTGDGRGSAPIPWWMLPDDARYLWRWLPFHLRKAGRVAEHTALVTDLRWVEAKTRRRGSVNTALADLRFADGPTAARLAEVLQRSAPLLGPIDPPDALAATLASRVHGIEGLEDVYERYRAGLAPPHLEPAWPLPDRYDGTDEAVTSAGVYACAWSPDGRVLALAGDDGATRLWSLAEERVTGVLAGHTGGVRDCAFSPDGSRLATASHDRTVRVWRVADGTTEQLLRHPAGVVCGAFSPDGAVMAVGALDGRAHLWRVADGATVAVVEAHRGGVRTCAWSSDGTILATAGSDAVARLWHADGTPRATLTGHGDEIDGIAFSPDGTLLATTGADRTARLWRVADGSLAAVLAHHSRVYSSAFSPDGTVLATTEVARARLWTISGAGTALRTDPRAELVGHRAAVGDCAFSPDGTVLATASIDQTFRLWSVADGTATEHRPGSGGGVAGCAFSPGGDLVAATTLDGSTVLRRVADGEVTTERVGAAGYGRACAFSPDGSLLATADNDGRVHLLALPDGPTTVVGLHDDRVLTCAFSPDGSLLATAGHDRVVIVSRPADGSAVARLRGHTDQVNSVAFSPDGSLLASAGDDHTVRLWAVADGREVRVITGHDDQINGVALSPDGRLVASASDDHTVRLWAVADGREMAVLTGHTYKAHSCAFSPDGTVLASIGTDGTFRLWDVATGGSRGALRVSGRLIEVAWHPGGSLLGAAGGAGLYLLRYLP